MDTWTNKHEFIRPPSLRGIKKNVAETNGIKEWQINNKLTWRNFNLSLHVQPFTLFGQNIFKSAISLSAALSGWAVVHPSLLWNKANADFYSPITIQI